MDYQRDHFADTVNALEAVTALEKAEIQMLTKGMHTTPLCPPLMPNQRIVRLDVSHLSLVTWISFTTLAECTFNLKVAFLPLQSCMNIAGEAAITPEQQEQVKPFISGECNRYDLEALSLQM